MSNSMIPYLRATKTSMQLIVEGEPFLMLAGELHNSSLSSATYMSNVWPKLKQMNLNTVLGSVTWEMIEPVEGKFDFSELDAVIEGARNHQLRLVLLWFGSFKNALSTYVPGWVKKDVHRFPRVHIYDEDHTMKTIELLSPFSEEACRADCKAFATLMKHIKEVDESHTTVIMVQVENETGMLGDSRDRSRSADKRYQAAAPADLVEYLKQQTKLHPAFMKRWPDVQSRLLSASSHATWEEIFGDGMSTEELFMADAFARYVAKVAVAGREQYNIPLYTNCWLNFDDPTTLDIEGVPLEDAAAGGGAKPGTYPSGGPVPQCLDVWRFHTSQKVDFISPDLYLHDYEWMCEQYRHNNNPLFIPEQKADLAGVRRTWSAYASYASLGCSPFGIDSVSDEEATAWGMTYGLLQKLSLRLLRMQAEAPQNVFGFYFDEIEKRNAKAAWYRDIDEAEMKLKVERSFVFGRPAPGYGMIMYTGDNKFLLVGSGFQVTFTSMRENSTFTGILSATEKDLATDGSLKTLRTMNGDETRSGSCMVMPTEDPDYGGFPIRITIPARTYVAEVEVYSLEEKTEI